MWNEHLTVRDDDLLSWRSLDTTQFDRDEALSPRSDTMSDTSGTDESVEVIDRSYNSHQVKRIVPSFIGFSNPLPDTRVYSSIESIQTKPRQALQNVENDRRYVDTIREVLPPEQYHETQKELPSTSEMIRIANTSQGTFNRVEERNSRPQIDYDASMQTHHLSSQQSVTYDDPSEKIEKYIPPPVQVVSTSLPPPPLQEPRRLSMTLGDFLNKKKVLEPKAIEPKPQSIVNHSPIEMNQQRTPFEINARVNMENVELKSQLQDMVDRDRQSQSTIEKQLQQIEQLMDQVQQQDIQIRQLQHDALSTKERLVDYDKNIQQFQTNLREKERIMNQQEQVLVKKATELMTLEQKLCSFQTSNEMYQEQARKAMEEKDKVHKDYLQVVYDLSKIQKQLNAQTKENITTVEMEKRMHDLRRENEQLAEKIKEMESTKALILQHSSTTESQRIKELLMRISVLEDELQSARIRSSTIPAQGFTDLPSMRNNANQTQPSPLPIPPPSGMDPRLSLLQPVKSNIVRPEKMMTLKDMMGDTQSFPASKIQYSSTSMAPMSLASFSSNRSSTDGHSTLNLEHVKVDPRKCSSINTISDLLRHSPQSNPPMLNDMKPPTDTAISAPFATERQTQLQDALQKKDMEQMLLKLHVEKEQLDAKLSKVEQLGVKTMNARTEKAWLENRLRDVTLEISRIKLMMR